LREIPIVYLDQGIGKNDKLEGQSRRGRHRAVDLELETIVLLGAKAVPAALRNLRYQSSAIRIDLSIIFSLIDFFCADFLNLLN
jgi:hypothetical protein